MSETDHSVTAQAKRRMIAHLGRELASQAV